MAEQAVDQDALVNRYYYAFFLFELENRRRSRLLLFEESRLNCCWDRKAGTLAQISPFRNDQDEVLQCPCPAIRQKRIQRSACR
jgi:hypothetical protein